MSGLFSGDNFESAPTRFESTLSRESLETKPHPLFRNPVQNVNPQKDAEVRGLGAASVARREANREPFAQNVWPRLKSS